MCRTVFAVIPERIPHACEAEEPKRRQRDPPTKVAQRKHSASPPPARKSTAQPHHKPAAKHSHPVTGLQPPMPKSHVLANRKAPTNRLPSANRRPPANHQPSTNARSSANRRPQQQPLRAQGHLVARGPSPDFASQPLPAHLPQSHQPPPALAKRRSSTETHHKPTHPQSTQHPKRNAVGDVTTRHRAISADAAQLRRRREERSASSGRRRGPSREPTPHGAPLYIAPVPKKNYERRHFLMNDNIGGILKHQ